MSLATTEAPADASPTAMDLPMPEPAPVTTATDPSIFTGTCLPHQVRDYSVTSLNPATHIRFAHLP